MMTDPIADMLTRIRNAVRIERTMHRDARFATCGAASRRS